MVAADPGPADAGTAESKLADCGPASAAPSTVRDTAERHVPVLLETCLELLAPAVSRPGSVVVDCTLGLGGHSEAMLRRWPEVTVVGIDRDPAALRLATQRLSEIGGTRFVPVQDTYDHVPEALQRLGRARVQGVLMDLGVSSMQIDDTDRGFAYSKDAPLDMRMDQSRGSTAAEVLNTYSVADLTRILREYGEERYAPRIARAVVAARAVEPWDRSARLVELVRGCVPAAAQRTGGNPAKRTFQALRIEVNQELSVLDAALPAALGALDVGGRMVVMAYHSLEDRRVKRAFASGTTSGTPRGLPVELGDQAPYLRALVRGALQADQEETLHNPRAASVRLRAVERVRDQKEARR